MAEPPSPLRVLWVATKPPWPPRDGGRLLQQLTLAALGELGERVEVDLVAPLAGGGPPAPAELPAGCRAHLVAARPRPLALAWLAARRRGLPLTAARHRLGAVGRRVREVAGERGPAVVHAEQVQAMPQALAAGLPVVLRAQNVESDLWASAGAGGGGVARPLAPLAAALRREGRRLAAWEGEMVRRAARTVAVTAEDAARLAALAGGADRVEALPVPFPAALPAGDPLPGDPAFVLLAGAGWRPNRDGAEAFLAGDWPEVRRRHPGAVLHVFGEVAAGGAGVVRHPAPAEPAVAFPAGGVLVVPLAVASGIRMKILEAWARGLPVVATPAAAAGLGATAGEHLLVATPGEPLVSALVAAAAGAAARERLAAAARALLVRRHDPRAAAAALLARWRDAAAAYAAAPRR